MKIRGISYLNFQFGQFQLDTVLQKWSHLRFEIAVLTADL